MQDYFGMARLWADRKASKAVFIAPGMVAGEADIARSRALLGTEIIRPVIRWGFYAFIFSIPFETADIGIHIGVLSLSRMVGYLFILLTLVQPRICFQRPPKAFWFFAAYLWVYVDVAVLQE